MPCIHEDDLKQEELENGEWIEICNDCGMSRSVWENGDSGWMMVDLDEVRRLNRELLYEIIGGDLILGLYENNQAMIDNDYMECNHCGNILFDEYTWIIPTCGYCNQNRNTL